MWRASKLKTRGVAAFIFVVICAPRVHAQPQVAVETVLDGVYSDAQATRGEASYTASCAGCHGDALEGVSAPQLTGERFIERWREAMLDLIYDFIRERMPPRRGTGSDPIPDSDYSDILAYILNVNGYQPGTNELTRNRVTSVMLVGMNGPQPVPDGSLVITVGCLSETNENSWVLLNATEPVRTRTSTTSSSEELNISSQKSLGILTFRLATLGAVPEFAPLDHRGHKIQAKGYLVRQPNAERINLSSIQAIDSTCEL
jgi:mono/diheme cytochrome c family protein